MSSTRVPSDARLIAKDLAHFYDSLVFPVNDMATFEAAWVEHSLDQFLLAGTSLPERPTRPDVMRRVLRTAAAYLEVPDPIVVEHAAPFAILALFQLYFLIVNTNKESQTDFWSQNRRRLVTLNRTLEDMEYAGSNGQSVLKPKIPISVEVLEVLQRNFGVPWDRRPAVTKNEAWSEEHAAMQFQLVQSALRTLDEHGAFEVVPFVDNSNDVKYICEEHEQMRRDAKQFAESAMVSRLSARLSAPPAQRRGTGTGIDVDATVNEDPGKEELERALAEYRDATAGLL